MSERNDLCASLNGERLSSRVAAKLADARGTCEPTSQVVPTLRQGTAKLGSHVWLASPVRRPDAYRDRV